MMENFLILTVEVQTCVGHKQIVGIFLSVIAALSFIITEILYNFPHASQCETCIVLSPFFMS